jgi:glycosyltransferase involved in cell wall biosynthesis
MVQIINNGATDTSVDIVIPVLNEAHILEQSVSTLRDFLLKNIRYEWRIVIADNGSTDGTSDVARKLTERFSDVELICLDVKGRGRALREAWQRSSADVVLYTDVDLSTELAALPKLVDALVLEGYDISTGTRLARGSNTKRCFKREVTSRVYNLIVKCILFTKFSDAQCGFKAVTRDVVKTIVPQVKDQGWFFDTELMVLAEKQGRRIKDIPVIWIEDDDSRVQIVPTAVQNIKGLFRLRWLLFKRRLLKSKGSVDKKLYGDTANK